MGIKMSDKSTEEDLKEIFKSALEITDTNEVEIVTYRSIPSWDSVGHMALVAEIEDKFLIELTTQQVLELSSFDKALEIVLNIKSEDM
jgi:acyl carrier protein